MSFNIKPEVLENIITTLNNVTGIAVQVGMDALARLVVDNEGNQIMDKLTDNCKQMQASYNNHFVPATSVLLNEYSTLEQFQDVISRAAANMTETKQGSTDITADKVNLPEV